MYLGAILCALICVVMIYKITTMQDSTDEWIVWICVIVGFCLFGLGFVYESRNKDSTVGLDSFKDIKPKSA